MWVSVHPILKLSHCTKMQSFIWDHIWTDLNENGALETQKCWWVKSTHTMVFRSTKELSLLRLIDQKSSVWLGLKVPCSMPNISLVLLFLNVFGKLSALPLTPFLQTQLLDKVLVLEGKDNQVHHYLCLQKCMCGSIPSVCLSPCLSEPFFPNFIHSSIFKGLQWCAIEFLHLLHKSYWNDVTLTEHNLF